MKKCGILFALTMGWLAFEGRSASAEELNFSSIDEQEALSEARLEDRKRIPIDMCTLISGELITAAGKYAWDAEYDRTGDPRTALYEYTAATAGLRVWQDGGCKGWVETVLEGASPWIFSRSTLGGGRGMEEFLLVAGSTPCRIFPLK